MSNLPGQDPRTKLIHELSYKLARYERLNGLGYSSTETGTESRDRVRRLKNQTAAEIEAIVRQWVKENPSDL